MSDRTVIRTVFEPRSVVRTEVETRAVTRTVGIPGKSAYQSYLDTTTDVPPKTEAEWSVGQKGDKGDPGPSGADSTVPGPQGSQGPQGPAGPAASPSQMIPYAIALS